MKNFFLASLALLGLSCFASGQIIGPSVINSTGGSAVIGGGLHSWSVGEMVLVSTVSTGNIIITQGVLQLNRAPGTSDNPESMVYPNPAGDEIQLKTTSLYEGTLTYVLVDMLGKVVVKRSTTITAGEHIQSISLYDVAAGTYTLRVDVKQQGEWKSAAYKIQKLK